MLQNSRPVRARLQVDTPQMKYFDPSSMLFLQLLQRRQVSAIGWDRSGSTVRPGDSTIVRAPIGALDYTIINEVISARNRSHCMAAWSILTPCAQLDLTGAELRFPAV